jgi:hypothetical protein
MNSAQLIYGFQFFLCLCTADSQMLRKLAKTTGDGSFCPCERCGIIGLNAEALNGSSNPDPANGRTRKYYPIAQYERQTHYSMDYIMSKLNDMIKLRKSNMKRSRESTTRRGTTSRQDAEISEILTGFSYYGICPFGKIPYVSYFWNVDLMHITENAGEMFRDLLRDRWFGKVLTDEEAVSVDSVVSIPVRDGAGIARTQGQAKMESRGLPAFLYI